MKTATAVLIAAVVMLTCLEARADVVLSGPTSRAGTYTTAALSALATPSTTFSAQGLTGISIWGFLGGQGSANPNSPVYGAITTTTPAGYNGKNSILRYYVVAVGTGGNRSVFSLGEIDPDFGGTAPVPAFIAFKVTGGDLLPAPQLVAPGAAGRGVQNLVALELLSVPALPSSAGGPSTAVFLSGSVTSP